MRTLIIPDLHNHTENANHWLETQRYDRVAFLGDYFDDFGDDASDARVTASWLRRTMDSGASEEAVFLLGNHDVAYMFPDDPRYYCPGFGQAKALAINAVLDDGHWARFRLVHYEQGHLLSHAGFHPGWVEQPTPELILARCEDAMAGMRRGTYDGLFGAGPDRGGVQRFGGPLWMDWDGLIPIPGIHQVVGHTPGAEVREKFAPESRNYCLDVRNGAVAAILEGGRLEILRRER